MSQQNVDLMKSLYEAFGRGDVPTVLGAMDPAIVWNEAEGFPYADKNPYVGPQAVLEGVFARLGGEWDGFAVALEEVHDAGRHRRGDGPLRRRLQEDGEEDPRAVRPRLEAARREGRELPAVHRHPAGDEGGQRVGSVSRKSRTTLQYASPPTM